MELVLALVAVLALTGVVVAGLTGRLSASSCCTVADPRRDARMGSAFEDDPA